MKLAVHTLTHNRWPRWNRESMRSVAQGLPDYATHSIIECYGNFQAARWEALQLGEFVAAVDDDDRLVDDALDLCVHALEMTGAGIAFTYEAQIDANGVNLPVRFGPRTYLDVAMHPRGIHHLAVMRRACLDPRLIEYAEGFGFGIDWLTKAWCALKYGAVQVPVVGYEWRRHQGGLSHQQEAVFTQRVHNMRELTLSWGVKNERVHQFLPRRSPTSYAACTA